MNTLESRVIDELIASQNLVQGTWVLVVLCRDVWTVKYTSATFINTYSELTRISPNKERVIRQVVDK